MALTKTLLFASLLPLVSPFVTLTGQKVLPEATLSGLLKPTLTFKVVELIPQTPSLTIGEKIAGPQPTLTVVTLTQEEPSPLPALVKPSLNPRSQRLEIRIEGGEGQVKLQTTSEPSTPPTFETLSSETTLELLNHNQLVEPEPGNLTTAVPPPSEKLHFSFDNQQNLITQSGSVQVVIRIPLTVTSLPDNAQTGLYLSLHNSNHKPIILPDQALSLAKEKYTIHSIEFAELTSVKNHPSVYQLSFQTNIKLLNFIPLTIKAKTTIDAVSGQILKSPGVFGLLNRH